MFIARDLIYYVPYRRISKIRFVYKVAALVIFVVLLRLLPSRQSQGQGVFDARDTVYNEVYVRRIQQMLEAVQLKTSGRADVSAGSRHLNSQTPRQLCDLDQQRLDTSLSLSCNRAITSRGCHMEDIVARNREENPDLGWKPRDCIPRHRVAVLVPYRDRYENLMELLDNLIPMLKAQNLEFKIYVVEQFGKFPFNRAKLFNVGFIEALKERDWQCFVFHDVDHIPENPDNIYSCPETPRHLSTLVNGQLPYADMFGGVSIIRTDQVLDINGWSNEYWGWGREDDDMVTRLYMKGYRFDHSPFHTGQYRMSKHTPQALTHLVERVSLYHASGSRVSTDGLNTVNYSIVAQTEEPLYTHLLADIGDPPFMHKYVDIREKRDG